jgi:hypothetical protein
MDNHIKENLEELKCDECGVVIGYVSSFDLQGSYFFCKDCKEKS